MILVLDQSCVFEGVKGGQWSVQKKKKKKREMVFTW